MPVFCLSAQAQEGLEDIYELPLEELVNVYVYTASRELTPVEKAPSVVTIVTAADIKQQGLKSLRDVLDRVTGVYNQWDRNFSLVSIRGYAQDPTNNILLLIDGHSINSQAGEGIGNTHLLPFLHQVKQIEIIRGPGSTLWGGDAAFGIINVITYSGAELADMGKHTLEANVDYEFDMKREIYNLLYGTQLTEGDFMVSASYTESIGNDLRFYSLLPDEGMEVNPRYMVKHDQHRPSYEVQAKGNWRDFSLNARLFEHKGYYRNVGPTIENEYRDYEFNFIEFGYTPKLKENLAWENKVYVNQIDESYRRKLTDGSTSLAWTQGYDEVGLSSILTWRPTDHLVKLGIEVQNRDFDGRKLTAGTSTSIVPQSISGKEVNHAEFADYTYRGLDDWRFVLGGRFQHFDLRQKGDYFLPRAALVHILSDQWTLKYAYNTGVVGTTLNRTQSTRDNYIVQDTGIILLGPEDPQSTQSHDLLFSYKSDNLQANLGLFHQRLEDYITVLAPFDTGETLDGYELWGREDNVGDLESNGIEIDWLWHLSDKWRFSGNYTYVETKFDELSSTSSRGATYNLPLMTPVATEDKRLTGIPAHLWNLDITFFPQNRTSVNVHYRGWNKAWSHETFPAPPRSEEFGPEHFVDVAVNLDDFPLKDARVQIYARNLFNNKAIIPQTPHGGLTEGNGAEYGIGLSYKF